MHTLPLLTQQFAELSPFFYSRVSPEPLPVPYWVAFNTDLAAELNLDTDFQGRLQMTVWMPSLAASCTSASVSCGAM